jgi:hypothetical protein
MYYLSFDVANKSLAVSFIKYSLSTKNILNNLITKNDYNLINNSLDANLNKTNNISELLQINNKINHIIDYKIYEVIDLIPNEKVQNTTLVYRSGKLNNYLTQLKKRLEYIINEEQIQKIILLIEYQPSFNDKSRTVYNQVIYEFSNVSDIYKIKPMNPMLKNQIYFTNELKHSEFLRRYNNNYIANKNHTKENFLYFLKTFNMLDKIKNIKKKNLDDIADSFMQIFAYIYILQN